MEKITLSNCGYQILQIETAAACNMDCSFCPYPLKEDKTTKLSFEHIKNIIDQVDVNDKKFKYITFSQFNEPLLDNRIFDIIDYAKKSGFKVKMVTNGLLLNKENNINNIIRLKPELLISLQVLDSNIHKEARGLNLDLDRYVQTIVNFCQKAKNKGFNVQVDVGCNYNSRLSYYLKKFLGVTTGDPAVPRDIRTTISRIKKFMQMFYDISDDEYKEKLKPLIDINEIKKIFGKEYIYQRGFDICKNVNIKIKPFIFGRRIANFKPIGNNFSCSNELLGILADGNIVPCCLAYNEDISMGKATESSLNNVLSNSKLLENLRKKGGEKALTCRKCFGEPTYRGTLIKNLYFSLPLKIRNSKFLKFFTMSY